MTEHVKPPLSAVADDREARLELVRVLQESGIGSGFCLERLMDQLEQRESGR